MRTELVIGVAMSLQVACAQSTAPTTASWRATYESTLRAPQGWLALAGLFWLQEGMNAIPLPARCEGSKLSVEFQTERATVMHPGANTPWSEMVLDQNILLPCGTQAALIKRGHRFGIRLRDPEAETRRDFHGLTWFADNEKYRVRAKWHAYDPPKQIPITNVLGDTEDQASPGAAGFVWDGKEYRLEPVVEDGELFFMFRDATSADATYGSGRFLKAAMPVDGYVELDFNRAYNPPCAYTDFATCPLPPKQNRLPFRMEAGEKRYGAH